MIDYIQYLPWVFMVAGVVMLILRRLAAEDERVKQLRMSRETDDRDEILREHLRADGEISRVERSDKRLDQKGPTATSHSAMPEPPEDSKPSGRRSRSSARREAPRFQERQAAPPASRQSPAWYPHMGGVVTLLILLSALVVILMPATYPDAHQKWAFGAIGTIIGFWLKH